MKIEINYKEIPPVFMKSGVTRNIKNEKKFKYFNVSTGKKESLEINTNNKTHLKNFIYKNIVEKSNEIDDYFVTEIEPYNFFIHNRFLTSSLSSFCDGESIEESKLIMNSLNSPINITDTKYLKSSEDIKEKQYGMQAAKIICKSKLYPSSPKKILLQYYSKIKYYTSDLVLKNSTKISSDKIINLLSRMQKLRIILKNEMNSKQILEALNEMKNICEYLNVEFSLLAEENKTPVIKNIENILTRKKTINSI